MIAAHEREVRIGSGCVGGLHYTGGVECIFRRQPVPAEGSNYYIAARMSTDSLKGDA